MPYQQSPDRFTPRPHSRATGSKGSNDTSKSRGGKPSQKAMLSTALQRANAAVQLDNAQNFDNARQAYAEACELLQQVLLRTSGDEDKRKLDAIRRTYASRIDELDQMGPSQNIASKALPARPDSDIQRQSIVYHGPEVYEEESTLHTERPIMRRMDSDDAYSRQSPSPQASFGQRLRDGSEHNATDLPAPSRPFVPGLLQSSFSRSPVRSRIPDLQLQRPNKFSQVPPPLSPMQPHSPARDQFGASQDIFRVGLTHGDISLERSDEVPNHTRDDSQNSWLDPIDESRSSSASSIHSRTSSMGYRRKYIRAPSGDTEAEFDTALDAAIEAAYDDGYEPMQANDYDSDPPSEEVVANALRKVELARERVRQTEREAYGYTTEREAQWQPNLSRYPLSPGPEDFFDDNSSEEEERMLEEMTRELAGDDFDTHMKEQKQPAPRESDSSGVTTRTWPSSVGSVPPIGVATLATVIEKGPAAADRDESLNFAISDSPPQQTMQAPAKSPASPVPPGSRSVRSRRLSGQNAKQLKIETSTHTVPTKRTTQESSFQKYGSMPSHDLEQMDPPQSAMSMRPPMSPTIEANPPEQRPLGSPFGYRGLLDGDDSAAARSASPSVNKLRKNFSSSSLRSMKSRNQSLSNLDDASDMSPGTPSSSQFATVKAPAVPALPTPSMTAFREKMEGLSTGGISLFDDEFHAADSPGTPNPMSSDAPVPLEACPSDFMLRPFWLMRCMYQTLVHPRGGYLTTKLFVPRDVWRVKGVKLKNVDDKIANCDFLTAALLKLAKVDTYDADAVLEEMQALEGVLEQVQSALSRKLGNEVGLQGSGTFFKEASAGVDTEASTPVPRSSSVSAKSSSFSWRRLRSKNSAAALGGTYVNRSGAGEGAKEGVNLASLPITANPTKRPAKRDLSQVQFLGANATYASSLARLFDAAQAVDQIARQVDDPGLRHADKTQVGLELCTRHAAEFFGFYICRFALADLGILMDKFVKRGTEWVLA